MADDPDRARHQDRYVPEVVEPRGCIPEVRTLAFNRWCVARGP